LIKLGRIKFKIKKIYVKEVEQQAEKLKRKKLRRQFYRLKQSHS
jgi:hypothetical protein